MEFEKLLLENEAWLMDQILEYAKKLHYTQYTSTLQEAWRLSIRGLSHSFISIHQKQSLCEIPIALPEDELTSFARVEAKLHRKRGVTLAMFLGLMKYYKRCYEKLCQEKLTDYAQRSSYQQFLASCFDTIEVAFCAEWSKLTGEQMTEELQHSNRLLTNEKNAYLTIFESLGDPIILLDRNLKILNLNHAAQKIISGEAAIPGEKYYRAAISLPEFDDQRRPIELYQLFPWMPDILQMEGKTRTKEKMVETTIRGQKKIYLLRVTEMLDVSEKFTSIALTLTDLTEKMETQQKLAKEVEIKNKFFSIIAHDLIAPTNAILFFTDYIRDNFQKMGDDKLLTTFAQLSRSNHNLFELISTLLKWALTQTQDILPQLGDTNLDQLMIKSIGALEEQAKSKGVKLEFFPQGDLSFKCDFNMTATILRNLISNAIKFTHSGGTVTLKVSCEDHFVTFQVRDTGIGMPAEIAEKLFSLSHCGSRKGTNREEGTGLGLKLCKEFVDAQGGQITVLESSNAGTCIRFKLPRN